MFTGKEFIKIFRHYIDNYCGVRESVYVDHRADIMLKGVRCYPNMCLTLWVGDLKNLERPWCKYTNDAIFNLKGVRFYIKFSYVNSSESSYENYYKFYLILEDVSVFVSIAGEYINKDDIHNFDEDVERVIIDKFMNKIIHNYHGYIKNKYDLK